MAQKYFKANEKKLESLRVARGWSREHLASKAIVSTRTLDSIMAGKQAVLSTFSKLAKALGTPVNTIIADFELPPEPEKRNVSVNIHISASFDSFDETKDLPEWLTKLLERVGGDEIWGANVSVGSTSIRFYLTNEQYAKLMSEYEAGNLDDLDIIKIWADDDGNRLRQQSWYRWNALRRETGEQDSDRKDKGGAKTG